MTKVSIITVCFNSEKTIMDTLDSIYNQSYKDYEYIIIDGQSTDQTLEIVKKYKDKFGHKLKIVSEPDYGLYDAMNKGINLAQGEIIGILNSDDWYEVDALQKVIETFDTNKTIDIVTGKMRMVTYKKNFIEIRNNREIEKNILRFFPVNHPATFVKKKVYDEIGGFDVRYKLSADYDFICRAVVHKKSFIQIEAILANMRMGGLTGGCGQEGPAGLDNFFIAVKENYLLIKRNTGHDFKFRYYRQKFILYLKKIKRFFIKSKYGLD